MHADSWSPVIALHRNKIGYHPLNIMCDLTPFVILSITTSTLADFLAILFMEKVVLSYIMIEIWVIDADSRFKGTLEDMCKTLSITYWPL